MSAMHSILDMTVNGMGELADADIVTGKAVTVGDKSIVPVLKLSLGLGGAGGQGDGAGGADNSKGSGMGGGAGGSVQLTPVAIIVRDQRGVRILKVPEHKGGIERFLDKLPGLVEKVKAVTES